MYRNLGEDDDTWKFGEKYNSFHNHLVSTNLLKTLTGMQLDFSIDDFARGYFFQLPIFFIYLVLKIT